MKNKMTIMLVLVGVLSLAGSAQAYSYFWCVTSGDWANPATWSYGTGAPSPSVAGETYIYNSAVVTVTTAGQGCDHLGIGYTQDGGTVTVAAGITWTVTESLRLGLDYGPGYIGTGVLNVYGTANVGWLRMSCTATSASVLNIYDGGTFNVLTPTNTTVGEAGIATINLNGNATMVVNAPGLTIGAGSRINLGKAGQLEVVGIDFSTQLQGYINSHQITAFGRCVPVLSYHDGNTYVASSNTQCNCTSILPGDLNQDCYVDMLDLAMMASGWLDCTEPSNANCRQQ